LGHREAFRTLEKERERDGQSETSVQAVEIISQQSIQRRTAFLSIRAERSGVGPEWSNEDNERFVSFMYIGEGRSEKKLMELTKVR
jgi:hypothetical protein